LEKLSGIPYSSRIRIGIPDPDPDFFSVPVSRGQKSTGSGSATLLLICENLNSVNPFRVPILIFSSLIVPYPEKQFELFY
jgi:hypothetical protein